MLFIVGALSLFSVVFADTPANCTYEDIQGRWLFQIGDRGHDNTVNCDSVGKVCIKNKRTLVHCSVVTIVTDYQKIVAEGSSSATIDSNHQIASLLHSLRGRKRASYLTAPLTTDRQYNCCFNEDKLVPHDNWAMAVPGATVLTCHCMIDTKFKRLRADIKETIDIVLF
uniref:Dipeptidyl-peptidase 1 n=1 Tax=Magallana gigas TaxID=29159 RepID=K1R058_MAGGI